MAHVLAVRRTRESPFLFHFRRQSLNADELFPALAAVFAAIQMDRFDADVDNLLIGRINGHGANVTFKDPIPAHSSVIGSIEPILRNAKIDDIGLAAQAIDGVDGSGFERNRDIFPRTIFRAPDKQTFLSAGVDTNGNWSCHGYASLFYLRFETNNHRLETITKIRVPR